MKPQLGRATCELNAVCCMSGKVSRIVGCVTAVPSDACATLCHPDPPPRCSFLLSAPASPKKISSDVFRSTRPAASIEAAQAFLSDMGSGGAGWVSWLVL